MEINKKIIGELEKCYCVAPLEYNNSKHFLVAAEKVNKCLLYDLDGNYEETVWDGPGGTMSIVQVPGTNGQFLATHRFYSPNDSKDASIVIVTPKGKDDWEVRTLAKLPFVHRFDILTRNGVHYLIACALKSGHEYKDDWSSPGKVYAAVLPDNLDEFNEGHQLSLEVIKDGMLRNHGYYRNVNNGSQSALVSCNEGVYRFTPPENMNGKWTIDELLSVPASDAVLVDLDEDGEEELAVLSPFHGDEFCIFKKVDGKYELEYKHPEKLEFLHALYGGDICGKPTVILGHRKGERNLLAITFNNGMYHADVLDTCAGAANVLCYKHEGKDVVIAANREIDEIAMYTLQ